MIRWGLGTIGGCGDRIAVVGRGGGAELKTGAIKVGTKCSGFSAGGSPKGGLSRR